MHIPIPDGRVAINPLIKAMRKEDPIAHVDLHRKLAERGLQALPTRAWPSGAATDELLASSDKLKKKHVLRPFIHVKLERFLPHWADSDMHEEKDDSDDQDSGMLRKIADAMSSQPKKTKKQLSFVQWLAAFDRYAIASDATGQWRREASMAPWPHQQ